MHQLAPQEEEAILMCLKNRLENGLVESVYYNDRVYYIYYFDKENLGAVRYIFDATTNICSLTVKTIYGQHTITRSIKNMKLFELVRRWLLRVSSFTASDNHDKLMKLLTD